MGDSLEMLAAQEIQAFQDFLRVPDRTTERKPGWFTLAEIAKHYGVCEETARMRIRGAIADGQIEWDWLFTNGVRVKVYHVKEAL